MARFEEPLLRGRPLDIDFLGFRSDTYRLQGAGWEIAESRIHDIHRYGDTFSIAIRHPQHRLSGMSEPIGRRELFNYVRHDHRDHQGMPIVLRIAIAVQYMIHQVGEQEFAFFGVDTTPSYEVADPVDLYNMPYFKPIDEGKEIFLRKASVEEIMQIALDKQEPEQARIRASRQQEQKREDYARGGTTKAKLIMVA